MVLLLKKVFITKTEKEEHFRMKHNRRRRMGFWNNYINECRNCPSLSRGRKIYSIPNVDRQNAKTW